MASIDWKEYKEFKEHSNKEDRFLIAIDFMRSYYNINNASDMFKMLKSDDVGNMLLERNDIVNAEGLESFISRS